jgi:hypothetical protein
MSAAVHRCTPENLSHPIALLHQVGQPHHAELFRAVPAKEIALAFLPGRKSPWDGRAIPGDRPTVLVIGDDDYASTDPSDWRAARGAVCWAHAVFIHAAGAEIEHYKAVVANAVIRGRLLFVETDAAHLSEWVRATGDKPKFLIVPHDGQHPVMPTQEVVQ